MCDGCYDVVILQRKMVRFPQSEHMWKTLNNGAPSRPVILTSQRSHTQFSKS